jgi:hypothetical protein
MEKRVPLRVRARDFALGFLAGALAVLIFHQTMVLVLSVLGVSRSTPWSWSGVPPFGVPMILNLMFWGGVWGIVFAALADRLPRWPTQLVGFLFGFFGPVLFGWTLVAFLKGNPLFGGWAPARMLASVLINGAYGVGLALIYAVLRRYAGPARWKPRG